MKSTNFFSRFLPGHARRVAFDKAHAEIMADRYTKMAHDAMVDSTFRGAYRPPQPWDNTLPLSDAAWLKRRGEIPTIDRRAYRGHVPPYPMPAPPAAPSVGVSREERIVLADLEAMALQAVFSRTATASSESQPEQRSSD